MNYVDYGSHKIENYNGYRKVKDFINKKKTRKPRHKMNKKTRKQ